MRKRKGFTLIELLIVVAIIAILAAIAIPNFLQAQIRAKVSRARSDLRNIGGATVAYVTENLVAPPDLTDQAWMGMGVLHVMQFLTSPIMYITGVTGADPFITSAQEGRYIFKNTTEYHYDTEWAPFPNNNPPWSYDRATRRNRNFNGWNTVSHDWEDVMGDNNPYPYLKAGAFYWMSWGPDMDTWAVNEPWNSDSRFTHMQSGQPYEPSNGTISWGEIVWRSDFGTFVGG